VDAVSLKLARNYTNEKLNSLPSNRPTKTVSFDGGIYSVGNDVVNGQVSDVRLLGNTYTNLIKNGNFINFTNNWTLWGNATLGNPVFFSIDDGIQFKQYDPLPGSGRLTQDIQTQLEDKIFVKVWVSGKEGALRLVLSNPDYSGFTKINKAISTDGNAFYAIFNGKAGVSRVGIYYETDMPIVKFDEFKVHGVMVLNLTQLGLAHLTADQCNVRFPHWFDGTKSTNSVRLVSVGKNVFGGEALFNALQSLSPSKVSMVIEEGKNCIKLSNWNITGKEIFKGLFLPSTQYTAKVNGKFVQTQGAFFRFLYTDGTATGFSNSIGTNVFGTQTVTSTVGKTIQSIFVTYGSDANDTFINLDMFQIEQGTVATS
jgi:hypothetical protein